MNKSLVGSLAIIFGSLVLSLQVYGLKIIQGLDKQKGSWRTNAIDYLREAPISLAICLTIAVIIYGFILVLGTDKVKKLLNN